MKKFSFASTLLLLIAACTALPTPVAAQSAGSGAIDCALGSAVSVAITTMLGMKTASTAKAAASTAAGKVTTVPTSEVNSGGIAVQTGNTAADTSAQTQKNFWLDRIASCAAKEILHQMTVSTINWINSGFNGSPAYLTDPGAFLLDSADQLTGELISGSGPLARGLCSPWNVDIRLSLGLGQAIAGAGINNYRYRCTLSTIIGNAKNATIDGFIGGDFSQGGWPAFISMTTEPQNNPYGSYLEAHSNLLAAIGIQQASVSADLQQGQGFMSWQSCKDVPVTVAGGATNYAAGTSNALSNAGLNYGSSNFGASTVNSSTGASTNSVSAPTTQKVCTTETPGSVIAHTLFTHTDTGVVETELANDINSVVNALVTQLTSQMLSKGLHALSSSGSGVSGTGSSNLDSYISQLQADTNAGQTSTSYITAVNIITASKTNYQTALACFQAAATNGGGPDVQQQIITLQTQISDLNTALGSVTAGSPEALAIQSQISSLQTQLSALQSQGSGTSGTVAQTDIAAINSIISNRVDPLLSTLTADASAVQSGGSAATNAAVAADLANAQTQATQFNQDAQQYMTTCQALTP